MNIEWYPGQLEAITRASTKALEMTGEAVRSDLISTQVLPFAEDSDANRAQGIVPGELQGSVFVDRTHSAQGEVSVVTNTPYARRLYYHPEFNFYQGTNPRAGGEWYEPYKDGGSKESFIPNAYAKLLRQARGQ